MTMEIEIDGEAEKFLSPDKISFIKTESSALTRGVAELAVKNEDSYKLATELGIQNGNILKRIEAFRVAIVKPFNDQVKAINDMFKKIKARFEENDRTIRTKMERYLSTRKTTESVQTVHTDQGRASVQKRMAFEIVDESLIPREYLMPDTVKIGKIVRARLVKDIPGVRIYEEIGTQFATR